VKSERAIASILRATGSTRSARAPFAGVALLVALAALAACGATESSRRIEPTQSRAAARTYEGPRVPLALGQVQNRSPYLRGIFSDGEDRLGGQARTILQGHLAQSRRFDVLDRSNLAEIEREATLSGTASAVAGAQLLVTGQVTEFGRREVTDRALYGILGRGRDQAAYARVTFQLVDARTSRVVHTFEGAGGYLLSDQEVLGFGSRAAYDSTLNGKVLDLAVREAVDRLVDDMEAGKWTAPR
jgi:curli biogenesis system outer membrane secretion channel CsgG